MDMPWEITTLSANGRVELNGQSNDVSTRVIGYGGTLIQEWNDGYTFISGGGLCVGSDTDTSTVGLIRATNDIVAYYSSDRRLKENITPIKNPLVKLSKINGVEFDWKPTTEEEKRRVHANEGHDIGVIAQEIEKVIPEIVETRSQSGYKAVKYEKIVPLLIEAIKELKQEVDELNKQIK